MKQRVLRRGAALTAFVFLANLALVPMVRAEEAAQKRAREMISTMHESGAFSAGWPDQRKAMETLKQRVKDSRLGLDLHGIEHYRKRSKVMIDLERQRLRRAARYLLDNHHGSRLAAELRRTNEPELVDMANSMELHAMSGDDANIAARDVVDNYMSYRFKGYEQFLGSFTKKEVRQVMVNTEAAAGQYIKSGGDIRALQKGIFAEGDDSNDKGKLIRWLIGAIAGVGLIVAIFFSLTTMTIAPFMTFMATVAGLLALLGRNGSFQNVFYGNPYGPQPGPYNPYQPWNPYQPYPPGQRAYPPPYSG
jgi:hypothetical protein